MTEINYGGESQAVGLLPTLSLELILAPQDRRYSTMAVRPVLVATCRGVLYNCGVEGIWMQIHTQTQKQGPTVHQYKIYSTFTDARVNSNSGAFTLSLTFRSAPWLCRALTTSRLPPLQAQCTALEPSWNTVGGPYPIYTADLGPWEAGALACDDNLAQSHHHPRTQAACPHVLLYLIFKVDIGSSLQKHLDHGGVSSQRGALQRRPLQLESSDGL